ncbi:MAG TPA: UPF0149 family protein [Gammaproteobacteria bacterium]
MTLARLDYSTLTAAIDELGLGVGASEFHGGICGILCAAGPGALRAWMAAVSFEEPVPADAIAERAIETLRDAEMMSWQTLSAVDFAFEPLLPAAELALPERVAALAAWCGGFLSGLGLGSEELTQSTMRGDTSGGYEYGTMPDTLAEVLADFSQISRAGLGAPDLEDAAQADFDLAELVEYVRIGVQLVFEQLEPRRATPDTSSTTGTGFQ